MANVVFIDNEDSENSVVEIEAPKKPAPLIVDLADDEIVINVKGEMTDTPLGSNVPWVSQYDSDARKLGESIEKEEQDDEEEEDDDEDEEDDDDDDYDDDDDGGFEVKEEYEDDSDEKNKECEEDNDEENEENNKVNEEGEEGFEKKGEEVIKQENEKVRLGINIKEVKVKQTDDEKEGNEKKGKKKKQKNRILDQMIKQIKIEIKNIKKDGNKDGRQSEKRNDQTRTNEGRTDSQAQQGSSNSGSHSQDSHPQAIYPPSWYTHPPYSRSPFAQYAYSFMSIPQQNMDDFMTYQGNKWTPEMVRFYDEDWGNEKDFVVEKLQAKMDKNPSLWKISAKDISFWKGKDKKFSLKCYNCCAYGHESYECKEEKRTPKCHMCGLPGHIAYKCPQSICLNCGAATTGYVTKCKNCKFGLDKVCERCRLTGHIYSECTDHWRLYHSTTGTVRVRQPVHEIYKPLRHRWCCNCGRRGHLQVDCGYCVKNSDFSDTHPFVISYIKAFTRSNQDCYRYDDPATAKRLKISQQDNIMTNPSQKHSFQRKTSQLRNRLRALKRDLVRRGREGPSDRRRHFGGGYNRFNFF